MLTNFNLRNYTAELVNTYISSDSIKNYKRRFNIVVIKHFCKNLSRISEIRVISKHIYVHIFCLYVQELLHTWYVQEHKRAHNFPILALFTILITFDHSLRKFKEVISGITLSKNV